MSAQDSHLPVQEDHTADEIEVHQKTFDQHFDPEYAKSLVRNVMSPINERYFKCEFVGFENLPKRNNPARPLIYVSNHSGMAFPWDAMMFSAMLFRKKHYQFSEVVRTLTAPALSQSKLMNPFMIENFWEINGAVEARYKNFETMMHYQDSNLLIYPEGVNGIGKGFNKKYQLQRFATSFVRMSLKHRTDVIPFATVNGEYINPYVYSWPWLNNFSKKIGIPYIPVGFHTLLLILLPWLFYYALPAKLTYIMGKRIKPYELIDKTYEDLTEADIKGVRDKIKKQMQLELLSAVEQYGSKRYSSGKILGSSLNKILKLCYYCPPGWPVLFHEHHRLYSKRVSQEFSMTVGFWSGLKFMLKNPITMAFYIPVLGWIPLLLRGYLGHTIKS